MIDVQKELNYENFIADLSLEEEEYREFIKHINKDVAKHHLEAISQDRRFTEIRCNNL